MSNVSNRRGFLTQLGLAASGAMVLPQHRARAIEPIKRLGESHFRLSLAAYSYRDLLTGKTPPLKLEDFITDCAKMGLDGTELTAYYFPPQPTTDYLCHIKNLCFRLGLSVSGTAVGNNFCLPAGAERQRQIQYVKQWINHAEVLGAPVIRIFAGELGHLSKTKAHPLVVEAIEECCEYAGRHGTYLALENHGGLTAEVDDMLRLVRDVRSPWFGVNLDTGNFHTTDIYGDLARVAPYAVNVQIKVSICGPDGKRRPSDFKRFAEILSGAGYRGFIVLEFEEPEDPRQACPRYLGQLREAFAAAG